MAQFAKKQPELGDEDFVLMGRTRALLSQAWELWKADLKNSPNIVKRMLDEGIKELHRNEMEVLAKSKKAATQRADKLDKKVAKKVSKAAKKVSAVTKKATALKKRKFS